MEYTRLTGGAGLRDFLEIPYDQLEEMNLEAKERAARPRRPPTRSASSGCKYLTDEKRIKAVTVCFTDLEGRLHMLDYDKKFLLKSADNLTFDGSSIRGFSQQQESDLRLAIDWPAFYWLPSDVFGPGKVLVFGEVLRARRHARTAPTCAALLKALHRRAVHEGRHGLPRRQRDRGLPLQGPRRRAALPRDRPASSSSPPAATTTRCRATPLRQFIDTAAEVQRAMGFANEKDHPEVAPSQFEMNYSYTEAHDRRRPGAALQAALPPGRGAAWT